MIDYKSKVERALKNDDMAKLLEGKDDYHCEFVLYGMCGADVTDWNMIIRDGIYPLYSVGYTDIPQKLIDAVNVMCKEDVEEVYCAFRVFFNFVLLENNKYARAPFFISAKLQPCIMDAVMLNKDKLKSCFKWVGARQEEGMWSAIKRWVNILKKDFSMCLEYEID